MSATQQDLLDAMDGVVMILDHELCIAQIGRPNWQRFLDDNPALDPAVRSRSKQSVIGHPVTQIFAGDTVRATLEEMFHNVLKGTRPVLSYRLIIAAICRPCAVTCACRSGR